MRSTEVARAFGSFVGRPDGFGSSDFAQIVDLFMLYRSISVLGADCITKKEFWAEDGSKFDDSTICPRA